MIRKLPELWAIDFNAIADEVFKYNNMRKDLSISSVLKIQSLGCSLRGPNYVGQ